MKWKIILTSSRGTIPKEELLNYMVEEKRIVGHLARF